MKTPTWYWGEKSGSYTVLLKMPMYMYMYCIYLICTIQPVHVHIYLFLYMYIFHICCIFLTLINPHNTYSVYILCTEKWVSCMIQVLLARVLILFYFFLTCEKSWILSMSSIRCWGIVIHRLCPTASQLSVRSWLTKEAWSLMQRSHTISSTGQPLHSLSLWCNSISLRPSPWSLNSVETMDSASNWFTIYNIQLHLYMCMYSTVTCNCTCR